MEDLDKGPALEADTSAPLFPAWWRILNKATDPTPSRRYQSAKALIKDLVNLRRKIAVASVLGLRVAKVAIALFVIAVIAVTVFAVVASRRAQDKIAQQSEELENLKQFKTGWENHVENMRRRALEDFEKSKKALNDSLKSLKNDLQTLPK